MKNGQGKERGALLAFFLRHHNKGGQHAKNKGTAISTANGPVNINIAHGGAKILQTREKTNQASID